MEPVYNGGLACCLCLRERGNGNAIGARALRPWWIQIPCLVLICINVLCILIVMGYSSGRDIFVLGVLAGLFLNVDYAIIQMWNESIAGTISGTVAQRFNPVAYYTVVSLTALIYYVSALISFGFRNPMTSMEWFYLCFEVLGLIILSLVLIFPASLHLKRATDLKMTPTNWYESEEINSITYYNHLMVCNISKSLSDGLHLVAFVVGWAMCVVAQIVYLVLNGLDLIYKQFVLAAVIASVIFLVIFLCVRGFISHRQATRQREAIIQGGDPDEVNPEDHDELLDLVLEVVCLYSLILGLVALSFGASDSLPFVLSK